MNFFSFILVLITGFVFSASSMAVERYGKPYVGEVKEIRAKYEDTFVHLARDYNLGYIEMRAANPYVDPWVPGTNKKLILPTRHLLPDAGREGIVINLPEMRLYYYPKDGGQPVTYPIGVGREGLDTPTGVTKITRKKDGPTWRPTPRMRKADPELPESIGPGPENPLGTHAMYLGWPEYLIHGTNRPFGIGRRISSGCIRMYPEDIVTVFGKVPVGTKVTVVDQPLKMAWIDNRLYLEANATLTQSIQMEEYGEVKAGEMTSKDEKVITKFAGEWANKIRWAAVRTAMRERKGYPVEIARRSLNIVQKPEKGGEDSKVVEQVQDASVDGVKISPYPRLKSSRTAVYGNKQDRLEGRVEPQAGEEPVEVESDEVEEDSGSVDVGIEGEKSAALENPERDPYASLN